MAPIPASLAALAVLLLTLAACSAPEPSAPSNGGAADGARSVDGTGPGGATALDGGDAADGSVPRSSLCDPLPAPEGRVIAVTPAQAGQLATIANGADAGDTIVLADGTYALDGAIITLKASVTLRGGSGDREAVILDGNGKGGEVLAVVGSNVTIADVTIRNAYTHAIHVQGLNGDIEGTLIHGVHVVDAAEQGIKINPNQGFADRGVIECSHIELTDVGRVAVRDNCYSGGIDAHQADGWRVRDNVIEGFWCDKGLSEHGVHFWTGSRDTIVERNRIRNCARGIGFGLAPGSSTNGPRTYSTPSCSLATPAMHYRGVIRNNFVSVDDSRIGGTEFGFDSGITLADACDAVVVHNSVASADAPRSSSIEWRFSHANPTLTNNLATHTLRDRGSAGATQGGNVENAPVSSFISVASGDLHLTDTARATLRDGVAVPKGQCDDDIDGKPRSATAPTVGADE